MTVMPRNLTVAEAAKILGMDERLIRRAIRAGEFPGVQVGSRRMSIPFHAFEQYQRGEWKPQR